MKKLLLTMLGVLMALPTFARDFDYTYEGQTLTYTVISEEDKTVQTKAGEWVPNAGYMAGNSVSGTLIIPAIVKDDNIEYSVTEIGMFAFQNCSGLTSVTIPNSVKIIGFDGFFMCSGLTEVTIGNSVQTIFVAAFCCCSSLKSVNIPNSVQTIEQSAFECCSSLTSVTIPNSVTSIGDYAFGSCTSMKSVTIPNSVTSIGNYVFESCSSLTDVTLLDGDEIEFGNEVFRDTNIKNAYIGRPLTKQVLPLSNLETLTIGNTVIEIGASMWKDASNLKTLTLGSSLTTIGDEAFSGCTSLTEVVVPPSVETIGASAFAGDTKLASIIMGHSVKTIGGNAYDGCPANTVSITAQTPPAAPDNTFSNYNGKLYLQNQSAVQAYSNASTCWNRFNGYMMIEPTEIKYEGSTKIEGSPGDTFRLTATLMPENVTLSQLFWRSTNPDIATVDENGVVTLHADINDEMTMAYRGDSGSCKIIAESLYVDGPVLEVDVTSTMNGIEDILVIKPVETTTIDYTSPYDVYNLSGAWVGNSLESLSNGFYIVRQGNVAKKVAIK